MEKVVVCLGDSVTWGFPWGPQVSWVEMLSRVVDGEFINQGINGNTTSDMVRRFDQSVLQANPTHVIIMGGVNDVFYGESFDRISWNIREMAEKAQKAHIKVILGLPTVVDDLFWEAPLVRLREWMTSYAREHQMRLIPFHKAFYRLDGTIRSDLLLADGGHPTEEGYRQMFTQIDLSVFED